MNPLHGSSVTIWYSTVSPSGSPYPARTTSRSAEDRSRTSPSSRSGGHSSAVQYAAYRSASGPDPRQQRGQLLVRGRVVRLVAEDDVDPEVRLHLVDEPDRLAGQPPGVALQRGQLGAQQRDAVLGEAGGRQLGQQRAGLRGQRHRQRPGLVLDLPAQRRVPGVRVDEARGQPVEPQPQQDVLAREIHTRTLRQEVQAPAPGWGETPP